MVTEHIIGWTPMEQRCIIDVLVHYQTLIFYQHANKLLEK